MKKTKKEKILAKTKQLFVELTTFFPHDVVYSFHIMKEKENEAGGHFSIFFEPTTRKIDFYIYQSLFEEIPSLNERQILWLKYTIAHEIGHLFIWELANMVKREYSHDFTEKTASDIAFLLVDLHKEKYGKK